MKFISKKQNNQMTKGVNGMPTIKEAVISLVKKLPKEITLEEIIESLYVKQKILKGQRQLAKGKFYTHEEAKALIKKWLR
jgi:hypothetical protein